MQRAFRERRERHVKELQDKLAAADQKIKDLQSSNIKLQKELDWFQAENKVLKDTAAAEREHARSSPVQRTEFISVSHPTEATFPVRHILMLSHLSIVLLTDSQTSNS